MLPGAEVNVQEDRGQYAVLRRAVSLGGTSGWVGDTMVTARDGQWGH